MTPAPHLADPRLALADDERIVTELFRACALREAVRPNGDLLRQLVLERITPLELELVARGISARSIPVPDQASIDYALQDAAMRGDDLTGLGPRIPTPAPKRDGRCWPYPCRDYHGTLDHLEGWDPCRCGCHAAERS